MGKAKKWIAGILVLSLAAGGAYKGLEYLKQKNSPEVTVVNVASLIQSDDYYYYDYSDSSLSGSITTNVVQNIRIDKDIIVGDLLVKVGDAVKKGDLLMTIDTTLSEMELGVAELEYQRTQQNLETARNRLYSLQHGGPIEEEDSSDSSSQDDSSYDNSVVVIGKAGDNAGGTYLAAAFPAVLAAEILSDAGDLTVEETGESVSGDITAGDLDAGSADTAASDTDIQYEDIDIGISDTIEVWEEEDTGELLLEDYSETLNDETQLAGAEENILQEETLQEDTLTENSDELLSEESELLEEDVQEEELTEDDDSELIDETEELTPTPVPTQTPGIQKADEGDATMYEILDSDSKYIEGDGTEESPFVFLCRAVKTGSQEDTDDSDYADKAAFDEEDAYTDDDYEDYDYYDGEYTDEEYLDDNSNDDDPYEYYEYGYVTIKGSFLNWMKGYDFEGTEEINPGGYWYALEFHENDTVDLDDRGSSRLVWYLEEDEDESEPNPVFKGTDEEEVPINPDSEMILEIKFPTESEETDDAPETYDDDYWDDLGDSDDSTASSMTRDEAIREKEQEIRTLEFTVKESEVKLAALRKKCETKEIYSRIDGTISYAGNPASGTSSMESFLRVKSKEGYYVTGQVSEMMLDQIDTGTVLQCTTDMGETFEAEVIEVADYPDASDSGSSFSYDGNPNASVYSFTASIADQSLDINEDTWLMSVKLPEESDEEDHSLTILKSFVKSENGRSYVMKEKDGVLVKQYVQVGKVDSYGYSVTITGGLRRSDKLAFPYSEAAVEGAKTVDGTLDQLYDYDSSMYY